MGPEMLFTVFVAGMWAGALLYHRTRGRRDRRRLRELADKADELLAIHSTCHRERAVLRAALRHACHACKTVDVSAANPEPWRMEN